MHDKVFVPPEITDGDIRSVSTLLGLPDTAFSGEDGSDPRRGILMSMETMDVAACPGSGKTTLLVAKLAILASKWQSRTRGICVLSHTNTARREIETRLGKTTIGRQLLSFPHFIGTIHSFVNEFLAVPWLHAKGYVPKMIDTEISLNRRWSSLPGNVRATLEKNGHDHRCLLVKTPDFGLGDLRWGKKGHLGPSTPTYQVLKRVCEQSASDGYFCYDEMFVWARDLIAEAPGVTSTIQDRFPLLFIDEAQDTTEEQSTMLHCIFVGDNSCVIRQRFGDGNQAIFDPGRTEEEVITDRFPIGPVKKDLPISHRFGQGIADLADGLGLERYHMVGRGPRKPFESGREQAPHTIFLFDGARVARLLNEYGQLLLHTFSEPELREGIYTAVGHVHKETGPDQRKLHVGHYWRDYNPELTPQDPKPRTFVDYVLAGLKKAEATGESHSAVEKIAEGILRLAGMAKSRTTSRRRMHSHRYVRELLEKSASVQQRYEDLVVKFALDRDVPTKHTWNEHWCAIVLKIAEEIAGTGLRGPEVERFLAWSEGPLGLKSPFTQRTNRDNIFRFPSHNDPAVQIRVGSIHSVKGETHTATLVLETFWYDPSLSMLKPWILGSRTGWKKSDGVRQKARLKLHYVAMTRPTHLLCLAMNQSAFMDTNGQVDQKLIKELEHRGWQVKFV